MKVKKLYTPEKYHFRENFIVLMNHNLNTQNT
jgi:hypothetical protein